MLDIRTLEGLPSRDLIREVVAFHLRFKTIADILKTRPADPAAAQLLIEAFARGEAPAWLTAYLLGCLRAREGYATVRDILEAAPGLLAESYAGVAMHTILGPEAFDDLARIVQLGVKLRTREGAAYGLGQFETARAAEAVFEASASGMIRPGTAGGILGRLPFDHGRVASLVVSPDERMRRLGTEIACSLGRRWSSTGESAPTALSVAVNKLLSDPEVSIAPRTRQRLAEWFKPQAGDT